MSTGMTFFLALAAPVLALLLGCLGAETVTENLTGWLLVATGAAFVVGPVIYYFRTGRPYWQAGRRRAVVEEKGDLSFWLLLPGFLLVFFGSPLEFLYLPETIVRHPYLEAIGLVLFILGLGLFLWARRAARDQYSGHVQVKEGQALVTTGPYRYLRHPAYSAYLLLALGIAVGYSSLIGLAALLLLLLPGLLYRLRLEEKLLSGHFPDEYPQYAHKTGRLIPKLW